MRSGLEAPLPHHGGQCPNGKVGGCSGDLTFSVICLPLLSYRGVVTKTIQMSEREEKIDALVEYVHKQDSVVSVADIKEHLEMSHSYAYELAMEAIEEDRIKGKKQTPVIGYFFDQKGDEEIEVLTSREGLLWAVQKYEPSRLSEARSKAQLSDLQKFVRQEIANGTAPVNYAWRFSQTK